jgi:streptogramin lyase
MKTRDVLPLLLLALSGCDQGDTCPRTSGTLCTYMGTGYAGLGAEGQPRLETPLYLPQDLTLGPDGRAWVMDWNNHRVRVVRADGTVETVIGTGELGDAEDGHAHHIGLNHPTHVTFDSQGRLILSAWHNSKVMRMDLGTGELETIAGTGKRSFGGDGGPAVAAILDLPVATVFGPDGSLYIADQANQRVRRVDTTGVITTVVGTGESGFGGDGGPALSAKLQGPAGQAASPSGKIAMDAQGNLYIADSGNQRVRKVTPDGAITTVAGSGALEGDIGEGVPAVRARLSRPTDVALGPDGSLYIADTDHSCIRKVDPEGLIHTMAGVCGQAGNAGDNGPATSALLSRPFGIEVGPDGTLYIADTYNHRIRVVRP